MMETTNTTARQRAIEFARRMSEELKNESRIDKWLNEQEGLVNFVRANRESIDESLGFVIVSAAQYGDYRYEEFPACFENEMLEFDSLTDRVGMYVDPKRESIGRDEPIDEKRTACVFAHFAENYHDLVHTLLAIQNANTWASHGWDEPVYEGWIIQILPEYFEPEEGGEPQNE